MEKKEGINTIAIKLPRKKRCKVCKEKFTPFNSFQVVCPTVSCALEFTKMKDELKTQRERLQKAEAKENRAEINKMRLAIKTKSEWKSEAKKEIHKWIRTVRDKNLPCISCGNPHPMMTSWGQWDAGHYRSVGSCIELEFEPLNIARQCKRCNAGNRLSGNPVGFRNGLKERHAKGVGRFKSGDELVEWLDGPHKMTNYGVEDFKEIIAKYKKLNKEAREVA